MKGTIARKIQWGKRNYRKIIVLLIASVWVTSTFFAYQAIRQPMEIREKITQNRIEVKKSYDYSAKVKPSVLYPEGGIITPEEVMFNSLTEQLIIKLNASVNTDKSVIVEGNAGVVYRIVAKDMWEREFELVPNKSIVSEGNSHSLLQEELYIDVKEIVNYIQKIEEETATRASGYLMIIKPLMNGIILDEKGNKIHDILSDLEIPFEITNQSIKFVGESFVKEFSTTTPIETVTILPQSFHFLQNNLSVIGARYTFCIISFISAIPFLVAFTKKFKKKKKEDTEIDLIDKKYKGKIIEVSDKVSFDLLPKVGLMSFKVLFQIADDKEEPIFKFVDFNAGTVIYYILGTSNIYYYSIEEKLMLREVN